MPPNDSRFSRAGVFGQRRLEPAGLGVAVELSDKPSWISALASRRRRLRAVVSQSEISAV